MESDELRRRWAETLGSTDAAAGWPAVAPGATCRPAVEAANAATLVTSTLSGLGTVGGLSSGTLSSARTLGDAAPDAAGTMSGGNTVGGDAQSAAPSPAGRPADSALTTGDTLGAFVLGKELGRGGMGVVYRARQRSLQREVAIKLVRRELSDAGTQETFIAEALVNGHLDHPNIVPVHELGRDEHGQVFLAMKLVGGTSWKELLHPTTDAQRAAAAGWTTGRHLTVLDAVANAVAFAHSKGIVHRDLKPENVMVGQFGEVLVMDWGIAVDIRDTPDDEARTRHRSSVTAPAGTPSYMAPELAEGRGRDIGPWTDTYLLGAILHEVLTGAPPHRGRTLFEVLLAASASRPPEFPASVPGGLAAICTKALARDTAERYRTVADLQQALREQARNRASEEVAQRARATLEQARTAGGTTHARYAIYAEAIAGFRQALAMWPGNPSAPADERAARLAYAAAARGAGDLGLAEVQLDGLAAGADLAAERTALDAERAAQAARARAARRNRVLLAASLVAIVGGSLAATALVNQERARTATQRDAAVKAEAEARAQEQEARRQKTAAEAAQQRAESEQKRAESEQKRAESEKARAEAAQAEALVQRDAATREAWNARLLVAGNLSRDPQPNAQAEAALALLLAQRIHPDLAPAGGTSSALLAKQLWARFALATRPPQPRWTQQLPAPVRGVRLVDGGVLVVPLSGPVEVLNDDGAQRCVLSRLDGADLPPDLAWSSTDGTVRAFTVSGTRAVHLATGADGEAVVRVWDLTSGTRLHQWKRQGAQAVALASDDRHVVVAGPEDGAVLTIDEEAEPLAFFWASTGRWSDARKPVFAALQIDGKLGLDRGDEPYWVGHIEAWFSGQPSEASEHPDAPIERRKVAARFTTTPTPGTPPPPPAGEPPPAVVAIDPQWGLLAATTPLPLRLGPAVEPGRWSAARRGAAISVVVAEGATVSCWVLDGAEERVRLKNAAGDELQYDEDPAMGGKVAWLPDGTCVLALDSALLGEGYLMDLDPATGISTWQRKIDNAVDGLAVSADGTWLAVGARPLARTKGQQVPAGAAPGWLLRRRRDSHEWSLDALLAATPATVRFTADGALLATAADGTLRRVDLSGEEPAKGVKSDSTTEPPAKPAPAGAWLTSLGGRSQDDVLGISAAGVVLADGGRLLHAVPDLAHAWFTPDGRTLVALAWNGSHSVVRRIPLVHGDLPAGLPPLRGVAGRWSAWAAAEPALAAEDGTTTLRGAPETRPVEAGNPP